MADQPKTANIVIIGGGAVGLSFVKFAKLLGLGYVGLVDRHAHKQDRAKTMGADEVFVPGSPELEKLAEKHGKPLDAVIDAVGKEEIINAALPLIKLGGSICVYGVLGDTTTVQNGKGPFNFNLFFHQWPTRAREREAQQPLCDWVRQGKLKPEEFITHEFPVEQINDALDAVKRREVIKALLRY